MATDKKNHKETEDQDIAMDDGFTSEDRATGKDSRSCDNMTDVTDMASGGGSNNEKSEGTLSPESEAALWKEKYMRLSAEFENYRKRTFKEKLDIMNAGGEDVVRSMLEVLDDMDRALIAMAGTDDMEAVKQGIMLIDAKLRGNLQSKGLCEIEAAGKEFDTDLHEAVARIEAQEKEMKDKIIDVVQKGYKLKDKIIRYAKVVVGQ